MADDSFLQDFSGSDATTVAPSADTTAAVNASASSQWSALDDLGSSASGVAGNILGGFGNLVTAQLNATALMTATGAKNKALTNAPTSNPNAWQYLIIGGVVLVAGFAVYKALRG